MTTPRQNLQRVFRHEIPEWIPLTGHVDPYNQPSRDGMDPQLAAALGTVGWHDEATVNFSRALGLDILDYTGVPLRIERRNLAVETSENGDERIDVWHTPGRDLRQVSRRCREDGTSYIVEHLVKNADDLPALAAVFENVEYALDPAAMEDVNKRQALIGDDGLLMSFLPGTPMGMLYRVYSGVETLAYLYADAPQALRDVFSVMEKDYQQQFRLAVQSAADAFVTMDDTSTTVISPAMFEEFCMDCTQQRAAITHAAGKLYFHHSCGLIRRLLPLYRRTRMDAVHAFTVPPIGDVTVAQGREALGRGITIIAGFQPLAEVTWDRGRVAAAARQLYAEAAPGDHFIVTVCGYPHRTMAQTRMAVEECRKQSPRTK